MDIEERLAQLRASLDSQLGTFSSQPTAIKNKSNQILCQKLYQNGVVKRITSYEDLSNEDPLQDQVGILFTDSDYLCDKYGIAQSQLLSLLQDFISAAEEQKMHWRLLDIYDYNDLLSYDSKWPEYNEIITRFMTENKIKKSIKTSLWILGGDDVIPIPFLEDPYCHGEGMIPCDMYYAFEGDFLEKFTKGKSKDLNVNKVRCSVARLPLEEGNLNTTAEEDFGAYFNISSMYSGGIPVGNVVMNSHYEWIPASSTMTQHLPLLYDESDPEMIKNGMYISPKLLTEDKEALSIYKRSLEHADLLMFNLHGADDPNMSGFYSEEEAFNPGLLNVSNARVFNTVACFGARFMEYQRDQSMLLSALYGGGILLYTGSLVSVPMYMDGSRDEARELLLNPGTGSEVFMRLYTLYQFKGWPAGETLIKAKIDYFNMCRHIESDDFALSTILMFSLYGNPMLHIRKRNDVVESARANDDMPDAMVKECEEPVRLAKKTTLVAKQNKSSLLSQIRGAVDENLNAIRSIAEQNLYRALGVEPRHLNSIERIERPDEDEVYSFNYHNPDALISPNTYCEVDKNGKLKRVYSTK